jgi:hypothetical protein
MIDKVKYELAKANGNHELLRGDEIARLVRRKYTLGAETRIMCNMIREPSNSKYFTEFVEHEEYVEACKAQVDAELAEAERRYRDEIQNT